MIFNSLFFVLPQLPQQSFDPNWFNRFMAALHSNGSGRNKANDPNDPNSHRNHYPEYHVGSIQHSFHKTGHHSGSKNWQVQHPTGEFERLHHHFATHQHCNLRPNLCQDDEEIHQEPKRDHSATTNGNWDRRPCRDHVCQRFG